MRKLRFRGSREVTCPRSCGQEGADLGFTLLPKTHVSFLSLHQYFSRGTVDIWGWTVLSWSGGGALPVYCRVFRSQGTGPNPAVWRTATLTQPRGREGWGLDRGFNPEAHVRLGCGGAASPCFFCAVYFWVSKWRCPHLPQLYWGPGLNAPGKHTRLESFLGLISTPPFLHEFTLTPSLPPNCCSVLLCASHPVREHFRSRFRSKGGPTIVQCRA